VVSELGGASWLNRHSSRRLEKQYRGVTAVAVASVLSRLSRHLAHRRGFGALIASPVCTCRHVRGQCYRQRRYKGVAIQQ
jgi:hypothetical protein